MIVTAPESVRAARRRLSVEERREQVVAGAAELFDRLGYATATMEDIAAAIGIAKPTLYHYFKSKEEILAAIHEEVSQRLERHERAEVTARLSPAQQLFEMLVDILELSKTHPAHERVWSEFYRELAPEASKAREARLESFLERMRSCLRRGIEDGTFRELDVEMTVRQITGMCSWAYRWLPQRSDLMARDVARQFWGNLWSGIAAEPVLPAT